MNIYQKMMQVNCSQSEDEVRKMIFHDPYYFVDVQPEVVIKKCHISRATLYRFCDKLEVNGISELKRKLIADYEDYQSLKNDFDFNYPIKNSVSSQKIVETLKKDYEKTLIATSTLFEAEVLRKCAIEIDKAEKIEIYASAGNIYFADNFKFQMAEIGKDVKVPHEQYLHSLTAATSNEKHFAIVISFGGRGVLVKDVLETLQRNNTKILLITSQEAREIHHYATYLMYMPMTENHYQKISSYSTRLSLLYILDALYTAYFQLNYEGNVSLKSEYYEKMVGKR